MLYGVIGVVVAILVAGGLRAVAAEILNDDAKRDDTGEIAEGGDVDAFALKVGDCLVEDIAPDGVEEQVEEVPVALCSEPHDGEVYAVFDLPDGQPEDYPGEEAVSQQAEQECDTQLQSFSAELYEDQSIEIGLLYPSRQSWRSGDREVACIAFFADGPRTGTLLD